MMFSKFFKWLGRKIEASERHELCKANDGPSPSRLSVYGEDDLSNAPIQLRIHRADGGAVLEYYSYDHIRDRRERQLYIVPESSDFATAIANSITMEYIRRS